MWSRPLIQTPDAKPGQRLVTTTDTNLRRHPAAKPAAIVGKAMVNTEQQGSTKDRGLRHEKSQPRVLLTCVNVHDHTRWGRRAGTIQDAVSP